MKTFFYFLLALCISAISGWVAYNPGYVEVNWLGYRVNVAISLFFLGLSAVIGLLYFIKLLGHNLRMKFLKWRQRNWPQPVIATTSEELKYADLLNNLILDGSLLPLPSELRLQTVVSSAAHVKITPSQIEENCKTLLKEPKSSWWGNWGLVNYHVNNKNWLAAYNTMRLMLRQHPKSKALIGSTFVLAVRSQRYQDALDLLHDSKKIELYSAAQANDLQAALLVMQAREAQDQDPQLALKLAYKAVKASPLALFATHELTKLLYQLQKWSALEDAVYKIWSSNNLLGLGKMYVESIIAKKFPEPVEALKLYKRAEKLASVAPEAYASRVLAANYAVQAELWGEAARWLEPIIKQYNTVIVGYLVHEVKRNQFDFAQDYIVPKVLVNDNFWQCRACKSHQEQYVLICDNCGSIGYFCSYPWTNIIHNNSQPANHNHPAIIDDKSYSRLTSG